MKKYLLAALSVLAAPVQAAGLADAATANRSVAMVEWFKSNCSEPMPQMAVMAASLLRDDTSEDGLKAEITSLDQRAAGRIEETCTLIIEGLNGRRD